MEVKWIYNATPPVNELTRTSKQVVVLTDKGYLNTGYWLERHGQWAVDGLLSTREEVVAYLDGLC